jgi:N utilization substance protein B
VSTIRRTARELALKTIFQAEVGKQPLGEVLDMVLEQLRLNAVGPINGLAQEAGEKLLEAALPAVEVVSAQSKRQLRGIARAMTAELLGLGEKASDILHDAVSESGHFDPDRVMDAFDSESELTEKRLWEHASKATFYPGHVGQLLDAARAELPAMREALERQITFAVRAGHYAVTLVHGTLEKQDEIDRRVSDLSSGWSLDRQAAVDRNILRLAAYELLYVDDVPVGAAINEAVELAKKYSTEESGRFVNGVLGALAADRTTSAES